MFARHRLTGRISLIALIAATVIVAIPGDAFARHGMHHAHGMRHAHYGRHVLHARAAVPNDVVQPTTSLPPMRYYGGPKSPMWRG
jgi:hypothetical protein